MHRFDTKLQPEDFKKITQTYGGPSLFAQAALLKERLPSRYIVLKSCGYSNGGKHIFLFWSVYHKVLSDYELERLKNPKTEEDRRSIRFTRPTKLKKALKQMRI